MNRDRQKKYWIAAGLAAAAALLCFAVWKLVGAPLIKFISAPEDFRNWVESTGWRARFLFMGMVILQVMIAFIPGEPFEIAAGYAFGAVEGTILSIAAAAIGSIITFLLVRKIGIKLVRLFFSEEKIHSVKFLKTSPKRDILFLIVYMLPGTPKDLLGYFAGLTDLPFLTFCLVCTFGRIPSVLTSTISGNALGTKRYTAAIIAFAATLAVSLLGLGIYNHICKMQHSPSEKEKKS